MRNYYYPRTIKGVTIALMDVFNDMVVYKFPTDEIPNEPNLSAFTSGGSVQEISVPITFGPVEKQQQSRTENHEYYVGSATDDYGYKQVQATNQRYYLQLPRLALELNGIAYNSERSYGVNEWREWFQESLQLRGSDIENIIRDYQPTPMDFNYTLHVLTDNMDYFAQIMENILPYFNPKLFLRVREFSFLNIERDLPVSMNGVNPQFLSLEIDDISKREVNATIDFTVEAYMFRPFDSAGIIKSIDTKFFVSNDFDGVLSASRFETSGVLFNSAGGIDTSAIPESFTFSGTYEDTTKEFVYFTSASLM